MDSQNLCLRGEQQRFRQGYRTTKELKRSALTLAEVRLRFAGSMTRIKKKKLHPDTPNRQKRKRREFGG
jgi:hypothetical protein